MRRRPLGALTDAQVLADLVTTMQRNAGRSAARKGTTREQHNPNGVRMGGARVRAEDDGLVAYDADGRRRLLARRQEGVG